MALRKKGQDTKGVQIVNPFKEKTALVETLGQALKNNGVMYNGLTSDEKTLYNEVGSPYLGMDVLEIPERNGVDRSYPFPLWQTGVTISTWVYVPENAKETAKDATLISFERESFDAGVGILNVDMNGTVTFIGGSYGEEGDAFENSNAIILYYDKDKADKKDMYSQKGKWVYFTMVVQNDWIDVYFDGKQTSATVYDKLKVGTHGSKNFNKGFSYRNAILERPTEIYKNWVPLLSGFTKAEREANDFSNFDHYRYHNSDCDSIMEFLTDKDTKLYIGGSYIGAWYDNCIYVDDLNGVMVDDMLFFEKALDAKEVAALYMEAEGKPVTKVEPKPVIPEPTPKPTTLPKATPKPTPVPTPTPEPTPTPTPTPEPTPTPDVTETPTPDVTETPTPNVTETPTPDVTETPTPDVTETPTPDVTETPTPDVTETPTPETWLYGDVDKNGKVEAADALMILKHVVKLEIIEDETALILADTVEDDAITASDALWVLKCVVKLVDERTYTAAK